MAESIQCSRLVQLRVHCDEFCAFFGDTPERSQFAAQRGRETCGSCHVVSLVFFLQVMTESIPVKSPTVLEAHIVNQVLETIENALEKAFTH